jgi:hypothetical protein
MSLSYVRITFTDGQIIYIRLEMQKGNHVDQINFYNVGFEVLTAVVMKSSVFWDITPCSPSKANQCSEEHVASIFRVEEYVEQETGRACHLMSHWFLVWLILRPRRWRRHVPLNVG